MRQRRACVFRLKLRSATGLGDRQCWTCLLFLTFPAGCLNWLEVPVVRFDVSTGASQFSALDCLKQILPSQLLTGSNWYVNGGHVCVIFTETQSPNWHRCLPSQTHSARHAAVRTFWCRRLERLVVRTGGDR